jgi:rubredoxin
MIHINSTGCPRTLSIARNESALPNREGQLIVDAKCLIEHAASSKPKQTFFFAAALTKGVAVPNRAELYVMDTVLKRLLCLGCGFSYDEALGLPEHGIAPGTRWDDLPDDWVCPDCGTPKSQFEMVVIGYAAEGVELARVA